MLKVICISSGYSYPALTNETITNALPSMTAVVLDTDKHDATRVVLCEKIFSLDSVKLENVNSAIAKACSHDGPVVWPEHSDPQKMLHDAYDDLSRMLAALDIADAAGDYDANDIRDAVEYCDLYK